MNFNLRLLAVLIVLIAVGLSFFKYRCRQRAKGKQKYRFPLLEVIVVIFALGGIVCSLNPPWGAVCFWSGLSVLLLLHWLTFRKLNDCLDALWDRLTKK